MIAREPQPSAARVESELSPFEIIRARQLIECELAALGCREQEAGNDRARPARERWP